MKSVIFTVFIGFLLSGCIVEKTTRLRYDRIIKNITDRTVELVITTNESASYYLDAGDSIIFEGYCDFGILERCVVGWDELDPISGRIVFDNEKEIIYLNSGCENGKNPLGDILSFSLCGYIGKARGERTEYYYYIDDSDYERAVPIED
jgi:hypothetical protein